MLNLFLWINLGWTSSSSIFNILFNYLKDKSNFKVCSLHFSVYHIHFNLHFDSIDFGVLLISCLQNFVTQTLRPDSCRIQDPILWFKTIGIKISYPFYLQEKILWEFFDSSQVIKIFTNSSVLFMCKV
jgi:hypothetical protein